MLLAPAAHYRNEPYDRLARARRGSDITFKAE